MRIAVVLGRRCQHRCTQSMEIVTTDHNCRSRRLLPVKRGKSFLEPLEFRQIVDDEVGLIRMERQIILMIRLGRIEASERNYLGYDWLGKRLFLIELRDVVVGHLLLFVVRIEDRGPVLSS